jgi:maleate isomerase
LLKRNLLRCKYVGVTSGSDGCDMSASRKITEHYGWRARIGLIYMASSTVMEPEFYAMAPEGVSVHTSRIHLPEATVEGLTTMMGGDEVERCTRELAQAPLHVIAFGGTSATFLKGIGWDREIRSRMEIVANGIPTTTTSSAVLRALRACGAERVSLVTPYIDEVTERGQNFLEQAGFVVVGAEGMHLKDDHAIGAVTTEQVYDFAREVVKPEADAVFISCTNLRTIGAIAPLEETLGIPVVSAIQASFWDCLRTVGVEDEVNGFGQLLCR